MGSERGDEYKRLRPVGEGTGSKESEYSEAPQRATTSRLVPTHQQDHRAIKRRCAAMVGGFKSFRSAAITLAGIELAHRIRKRQFSFGRGRYHNFGSLKQIWDRALA
jgi:transposase-like protein